MYRSCIQCNSASYSVFRKKKFYFNDGSWVSASFIAVVLFRFLIQIRFPKTSHKWDNGHIRWMVCKRMTQPVGLESIMFVLMTQNTHLPSQQVDNTHFALMSTPPAVCTYLSFTSALFCSDAGNKWLKPCISWL